MKAIQITIVCFAIGGTQVFDTLTHARASMQSKNTFLMTSDLPRLWSLWGLNKVKIILTLQMLFQGRFEHRVWG